MFIDLTQPERQRFIKQASGCHIPGYTGHCPTLKFRYGKRYGANTKTILEELRDISPIPVNPPYRHNDPNNNIIQGIEKSKDIQCSNDVLVNLSRRPYILGYTGYIPGLNFLYGSSFSNLADKSVLDFSARLTEEEMRRQKERMAFVNTCPHLASIRGKDDVTKTLQHFNRSNKMPEFLISPESPPIAGYTGHIPRLKGSEASLSQRYHSAAQMGLTLLEEERKKRNHLDSAKEAVRDAILYTHAH